MTGRTHLVLIKKKCTIFGGREDGGLISSFSHYYTSTLCIQDFSVFSSQNVNKHQRRDRCHANHHGHEERKELIQDKNIPRTPAVTRISRKLSRVSLIPLRSLPAVADH